MKTVFHPRLSWRWKALIPLLAATVLGLLVLMHFVASLRLGVLHFHIIVGLVVLTLALVTLLVLLVQVQRPLSELRTTIARTRQGDREVRVGFAEREDEIGELGSDFNEMVHDLQVNCERCERLHRAELREAEHLATLGEVAAGLAHEIRNPLAGIQGAIEVVREEFPADSPSREILKEVGVECDRIKKLVSNLLSYAKPKEPSLVLADMNATVRAACQFGRQMFGAKNFRLEMDLDPDVPEVWHDPQLIQQLIVNLLLNSVQALDEGGSIQARTRFVRESGSVEVMVQDSGPGISPELLSRIFQPFFTTKGSQGTGLGLSLSKRIVEQHGGSIHVNSVPRQRTEFVIRLPAEIPEPATKP